MKASVFSLLLCASLISAPAFAGPFGTEMGDKPEKFKSLMEVIPGFSYGATSLPKTHTEFSSYSLFFAPSGLAFINASTGDKFDEKKAKKKTVEIKKQLIEKYGSPAEDKEQFVIWNKNLPANIESIILMCYKKEFQYRIELKYWYKNFKEYKEAIRKNNIDAL